MCQPTMTKVIVTGTVGAIFLILGCVLIPVGEMIVNSAVESDVVIAEGSAAYETWLTPPTPIYMQFWVWDLTNSQEFLAGEVPFMVQKGPYTYQEYRVKEDLQWNNNGTVSYTPKTTYIFREELSVGPETDTFTTVNIIAISLANLLKYDPQFQPLQYLLHELSDASTVIEVSVGGILWGYEDAYLKLFEPILGEENIKFGIFMDSNGTDEGRWTVFTGADDISKVNEISTWRGQESLDWWSSDWANMINGTDGTVYPPFVTPDTDLYVFVDDICRSGFIRYEYDGEIRGISVGHFSAPDFLYANITAYPDNIGFCTPKDNLPCAPSGLLNGSTCQSGYAPIYFSSPHFLYGSQQLFDAVHGMNPKKTEHEVAFDLEMLTGIAFQVHNRLQVNVKVDTYLYMKDARMIKEAYFPILWLNESSVIDEPNANDFIKDVLIPQYILLGITVVFISVGGGLFLGALCTFIIIQCRRRHYRDISPDMKEVLPKS